jgi:hypothetical protein
MKRRTFKFSTLVPSEKRENSYPKAVKSKRTVIFQNYGEVRNGRAIREEWQFVEKRQENVILLKLYIMSNRTAINNIKMAGLCEEWKNLFLQILQALYLYEFFFAKGMAERFRGMGNGKNGKMEDVRMEGNKNGRIEGWKQGEWKDG